MKTLSAFNDVEFKEAGKLLAAKVATMLGRKMEEGDWSFVYCNAKRIRDGGWSNLNIDVCYKGLGIEHKMLCIRKTSSIKVVCGTTLMHPSATRSIRIPTNEDDPNLVCRDVLTQYGDLIRRRSEQVAKTSESGNADMRTGWLLWKETLDEFLYFEESMIPPRPSDFYAQWNETPARGARKATRSLWIYDKATNAKRYSVTTTAGAKIQPYFEVPSPADPNLYFFKVQGNVVDDNLVEIWITRSTEKLLKSKLEKLSPEELSEKILAFNPAKVAEESVGYVVSADLAVPVKISVEAYEYLKSIVPYVSDEQIVQSFAQAIHY